MFGENTLDQKESDDSVEMHIMLPMHLDGRKVFDAVGTYLFTAASEEIAEALLESFDEALRICMMHPKKMDTIPYAN